MTHLISRVKKLKTKYDVMKFLKSNKIEYGCRFHDGTYHKNLTNIDFDKYMVLQTPDQVLENRLGVCWDLVELQQAIFDHIGLEYSSFFIGFFINKRNYPSHTLTILEEKDEYFWFEYSWFDYRGIHGPFGSKEEILVKALESFNINKFQEIHVAPLTRKTAGMTCKEYIEDSMPLMTRYKTISEINE